MQKIFLLASLAIFVPPTFKSVALPLLRRTKTCLRSCIGQDRLASLILMNYHYSVRIDAQIVRRFIERHPRRLFSSITSVADDLW